MLNVTTQSLKMIAIALGATLAAACAPGNQVAKTSTQRSINSPAPVSSLPKVIITNLQVNSGSLDIFVSRAAGFTNPDPVTRSSSLLLSCKFMNPSTLAVVYESSHCGLPTGEHFHLLV